MIRDIPYFHLFSTVWRYAGERRRTVVLFVSLTVGANVAFLLQPVVIGALVNVLQRGGPGLLRQSALWLGANIGLLLLFWAFHGPARVLERNVAFHVKRRFLQRHYDLLTQLPIRWHQEHHSGNTIHRITKASQGLYDFADSQFLYVENFIRFFGALALLAWISPLAAGAEAFFAALIFALLIRQEKKQQLLLKEQNEKEHLYSAAFFDYVGNMPGVLAFNLVRHTRSVLDKALDAVQLLLRRYILTVEVKWFNWMILAALAEFGILLGYVALHLRPGQTLLLGNLVALYQYLHSVNAVFGTLAMAYQGLTRQDADLRAAEPLHAEFERLADRPEGRFALEVREGAIEFEGVGFSYHAAKPIFQDFTFRVPGRQKVGLVGHSGAGKTTLVQLLLRFQDPEAGTIRVDGQEIGRATQESLRRHIAVIPQDVSLFEASLLENIRYGRVEATDAEVQEAARRAHADEFIRQLPQGYGTHVGERGVRLSGGQRQRIAIARAILKDAPILILDEATSALDSESERYIQESLAELMEGKTVLAIAHRLSTISHLDRLVVLEKGRIAEEGTHAALLARPGAYARLWALQSGGFLPE